jgi:NAD(P)-dependent dehydrogenase (short-subunit alcohol dehydrogenase family)
MTHFAKVILAFLVTSLLLLTTAIAEKRIALVIGNNDYLEVPKLQKAVGDAKAISEKLAKLGFKVTLAVDLDRRKLNQALARLYSDIEPGDTVAVHFSGHGVELQGQNYLLPIDAPAPENGGEDLLKSETLSLQQLVETLVDKKAGARILIIDACRDNPFAAAGKRSIGGTRGLGKVDVTRGTFIMYSAGNGQAALDRLNEADTSPTSVYTRVLLQRLDQPGITLRDLAATVREDVFNMAKTVGHEQYPAYYDEMPSNFLLSPASTSAQTTNLEPPKVEELPKIDSPEQPPSILNDEQAFKLAQSIDTIEAWNAFLTQHPESAYTPYAKAAREKLIGADVAAKKQKQEQQASVATPRKVVPPKPKPTPPSDGCSRTGRVRGLDPNGDNFLAVRTGPGTGFQETDRIFTGDKVSICSRQGKWYRVKYGGGSGWVYGKYIAG